MGPLGGLLGPPEGILGRRARFFGSCSLSWAHLGALLGRPGRLLGRLGVPLGRLGTLQGVSWAVLGRSSGPVGPSWSVGKLNKREDRKHRKKQRNSTILASPALLGGISEGSWGVLWGPFSSLKRIADRRRPLEGVLEVSRGRLGPPGRLSEGPPGRFWAPQGRARAPVPPWGRVAPPRPGTPEYIFMYTH